MILLAALTPPGQSGWTTALIVLAYAVMAFVCLWVLGMAYYLGGGTGDLGEAAIKRWLARRRENRKA